MTSRSQQSTALALILAGLLTSVAFGQGSPTGSEGDNGPAFQPSVTAVRPMTGPVGTKVTIKGINLSNVTAVVFQPNIETKARVIGVNKIEVIVPAGAQSGPVLLETPDGYSKSAPVFNVATPR
jgi:large repetitive protein